MADARRAGLAAALACGAMLLLPARGDAHALLVSSAPPPDAELGTAPGAVVLEFSESLNPRLSTAAVIDPAGRRWPAAVTSGPEMRAALATNQGGVYQVRWTSVSVTDGHGLTGGFRFGVRVSLAPSLSTIAARGDPGVVDLLLSVAGWVEVLALLLLTGQQVLIGIAGRAPPLAWVRSRFLSASVALSAGLVAVWGEATIASGGHSLAAYGAFFSAGISGPARLLRVAAEALALLAASRGWRTLPLWTVAALAGLAASGHAVDVHPAWWGVLLNAVHLVAAGAWAGAILALAGLRPPGGWRGEPAGQLLRRFAPVALTAFLTTVLTGALQALAELGSWAALAATGYGRVLLAKIGVVGLMVPLSLLGWRGGRPRPRIEAGLAAAAAAAAALLAAFPVPPSLAVERAGRAAVQTAAAGLPGPGELTLGGSAGSVLVGLTIVPARPGSNTVRAYLLPAAGAAAASASPANVSTGGITRPMKSCGAGCRTAAVDLRPGDELDVDVLGPSGGRAGFIVPPLPAPPGDALLSRMQAATHALRTYAVSETLSSGAAIVRSDYTAQAPDRSRWAVRGATGAPISETVVIGTDQYTKPNPDAGWQLQRGVPPVAVPAFVWDYFEPLSDVWVTGVDTIGGVATTEISAFGSRQATPIWFTFWVGADGLARRVAMHAPGHFMTDSYAAFDSPQNIVAPVPGS